MPTECVVVVYEVLHAHNRLVISILRAGLYRVCHRCSLLELGGCGLGGRGLAGLDGVGDHHDYLIHLIDRSESVDAKRGIEAGGSDLENGHDVGLQFLLGQVAIDAAENTAAVYCVHFVDVVAYQAGLHERNGYFLAGLAPLRSLALRQRHSALGEGGDVMVE